ncbi:MAG: hypothetical protein MZV64_59795 [Ignavibacteriales bacterium]|nr:hypothetical protein [Ignavibacteriales bacterium]
MEDIGWRSSWDMDATTSACSVECAVDEPFSTSMMRMFAWASWFWRRAISSRVERNSDSTCVLTLLPALIPWDARSDSFSAFSLSMTFCASSCNLVSSARFSAWASPACASALTASICLMRSLLRRSRSPMRTWAISSSCRVISDLFSRAFIFCPRWMMGTSEVAMLARNAWSSALHKRLE